MCLAQNKTLGLFFASPLSFSGYPRLSHSHILGQGKWSINVAPQAEHPQSNRGIDYQKHLIRYVFIISKSPKSQPPDLQSFSLLFSVLKRKKLHPRNTTKPRLSSTQLVSGGFLPQEPTSTRDHLTAHKGVSTTNHQSGPEFPHQAWWFRV